MGEEMCVYVCERAEAAEWVLVGLVMVELICEQWSSRKNLGLEGVESINLYFWVEGEMRFKTCARRHNVLERYVVSCKLKNLNFCRSLLADEVAGTYCSAIMFILLLG